MSPSAGHPAFVDASRGGVSLSYPELLSQVCTLARSLQLRLGLCKGDVAFVLSPACVEVPVLYFALLSIGAVVSPSNPAYMPQEISRQLQLSRPSVVFTTSADAHKLKSSHVSTVLLDSALFRSLLHENPEIESPGPEDAAVVHQSDVAAILYSSGTTSLPKPAALTHRNFIAMIAGALRQGVAGARSVTLLETPAFHIRGFVSLLNGVAQGETTVMVVGMELLDMLRAAERLGATQMIASPLTVVAMSQREEAAGVELRVLERVVCGGAPLQEEVARRFEARFPWVLLQQGYGATESGSIAGAINREECRRYGSVGCLRGNVEAKIVDHVSGEALGVGCRGEFWVRSPHVMKGYLDDHEANVTSFSPGGWLKTGDLCFFDEDGFLFIIDRLKEMIKYKGYQVAPRELELLLQAHPEVIEAAVIPYPDEAAGEIPMAFVVRQQGSTLTESQVMEFVAKQVAPYKRIRKVAFINSIPKSPAGKLLKRDLATQVTTPSVSGL